ncbi:hypothetical protein HanXRQr2_Chr03g0115631 [Helianthus annuus]|uniref:Uncharacterized protein n=1 Tax=Helianthus annuus TaxID=4232 RepID=A0A9K3NWP6_HELAN|nr:hypothetical protein HanXRQr2_Chr03g0115631 [Helianthus annuus]KAJ0774223.1 hypothetical protein HanOQP8_Chr03g0109131 [Helianthus annuus]KAJ0944072.1 hypothetical protein HanPSC8_Chr03g0112051 [Helianthus annuus]
MFMPVFFPFCTTTGDLCFTVFSHLGNNQLSGDIPLRLFSSNMKLIHLYVFYILLTIIILLEKKG